MAGEALMRAPAFWQAGGNRLAAWLLAPIGWLYGRIALARLARQGERVASFSRAAMAEGFMGPIASNLRAIPPRWWAMNR
jgi:hypothetical protein